MATKNRIAYALPIIQIIQILSDKLHKQMCLRLIYRERVGMITKNIKTPEKSVFIELFGGSFLFRGTVMGLKK